MDKRGLKRSVISAAIAIFTIQLLLYIEDTEHTDNQLELNYYCNMVQEFITSGGENGWPDYKGIYNQACKVKPEAKLAIRFQAGN